MLQNLISKNGREYKEVKKLSKDIMKNKEKAEPKASKKKSIDNN